MNWKVAKGGEESWQWKALLATRDKDSGIRNLTGTILRAALRNNGRGPGSYPRFATRAEINANGVVVADCATAEGVQYHKIAIESDIAMRDRFRYLADELKLLDWERTDLLACLKDWIAIDRRNKSVLDKDG